MNQLQEAAAAAEVDVLTSAKVSTVFAEPEGRVTGVAVSRPDGAVETIGCDTLIIATCGFGANADMIAEHLPRMRDARYYGHEGNRGDGIAWGLALGGVVADMGAYQALGSLAEPQSIVIPHTLLIGGGVQVNVRGQRFENELENISGQALTILEQPGGICWIVYDERLHHAALERFAEYRDAAKVRACKSATTIGELAATCKLPADELSGTLDGVAQLALDNETDEFGRRFNADEILTPPYYAIRVTGALFHTQGGLCVDRDARVLTRAGDPLPNVYAGGGAARSVSGPGEWGYLPGMGLCTAVTLGRIAGIAAARQALT
jgi:fumarate reductase flavoprotein subunit